MGVSPIQTDTKSTIDRALTRVKIDNATAVLHIDDIRYAIRGTRVLWNAFMRGDKNPSRALGPGEFRSSWGDYGTRIIYLSTEHDFLPSSITI